jgi:serine phosphatase RsbU (regulator of sigma subunit)
MELSLLSSRTAIPLTFTDVVYLTTRGTMPSEIRRLMRQKKLTYAILPFDSFNELRQQTHLIGCAIVDAMDLGAIDRQEIGGIIQTLELKNVGVIVLSHPVTKRVRSFSLSPTKTSFSMSSGTDVISINDLWVRISVSLACRKKSHGIVSKSLVPASKLERLGTNRLAEQVKQTSDLMETLTEQFRLAGQVQRDFLPSSLPQSPNLQWAAAFMPAEWVSGDIYNVTQLDDTHIGFYIVDAVGHGMPAALLTIFVKQAMQLTETRDGSQHLLEPVEVMKRLNVIMSREKLSGYQFATCFYGIIETTTNHLTFSRAGHPYPLLLRGDEAPRQLEVRGALLGVFEEAQYSQETVQLQSGDKLFLFSDGAEPYIGTVDEQSHFMFHDSFCEITQSPIVEMLDRFVNLTKVQEIDAGSEDDVTLLGLEILASSTPD